MTRLLSVLAILFAFFTTASRAHAAAAGPHAKSTPAPTPRAAHTRAHTAAPAARAKGASGVDTLFKSSTFKGLALRGIGPAINSGRVVDIAVAPGDKHT